MQPASTFERSKKCQQKDFRPLKVHLNERTLGRRYVDHEEKSSPKGAADGRGCILAPDPLYLFVWISVQLGGIHS